ncbi:UNVERIFIED_CONTAM: hypothetical protein FKN15_006873 [Acipenser sinensis]
MAAQDELNQLERVFLRLGHAETDEQLQHIISKFLPPVLLKLSSIQEGVRKKVMELPVHLNKRIKSRPKIQLPVETLLVQYQDPAAASFVTVMELLVHLNKRIKSRPKIQLPVETLLVQYQDPAAASFVTNFTIIYIKMGYPRLDVEEQCELAPTLLTAMEGKPQPQQDSLMHLLIPTLFSMKYPSEPSKVASPFILVEKPKTVHLLLDFMLDVLMMPYGYVQIVCPIWLINTMLFFSCKLGIVKFIKAEQVPEVEAVVHLVIASSDTRHSVATAADLELKSKQSIIDWNNPSIINKIYKVYLGDIPLKTKEGAALKPELKREPASPRVKLKILPHLLRSRLAADTFPANIQVVYDGLFGANTNNKLRSLSLQFVHHICLVCPDNNKPLGLMLLNGLTKLINECKEDPKLLCVAYSAVGKLSSRMPELFSKDIALVQQFFEAMCKDDPEIRLSIQEALSLMVGAYTSLQGALLNLMEALVAAYMEKPEVQVRQVAMKFASTVFASDHIPSRYLLLLAAGDLHEEVHGEAQRVLRAFPVKTTEKEGSKPMPSFPEMVSYIQEKASQRMETPAKYTVGTSTLPFNPSAFGEIILYLRMCLAHSAGAMPTSQSLADMQDNSPAIASYVRNLLSGNHNSLLVPKGGDSNPVQLYMELLQQLLSAIGGVPVMYCLLEVVSVYPQKLAAKFTDKIDWIKGLMNTNKEDMRELAAQLYAVVVSTMSGNDLKTAVQNLVKITKDNHSPETQHGAILALGYLVGRYLARKKVSADIQNQEQPMITRSLPEDEELIRSATNTIGSFLDSPSPLLTVAACTALGEISRNGALLIPNEGTGFTKLHLVESLLARIPSGKESNKSPETQHGAILALGYLVGRYLARKKVSADIQNQEQPMITRSLPEDEELIRSATNTIGSFLDSPSPLLTVAACTALGEISRNGALLIPNEGTGFTKLHLVESLLARIPSGKESNKAKQLELQFTVGEAITSAAIGTSSVAARDVWTCTEEEYIPPAEVKVNDVVPWVRNMILNKYIISQNPHVRQASCIWLLSLVKKLSQHKEIKSHLKEIQIAFISILSDPDELSQDVASKGLGMVYELGNEQDQQELVSTLVETLMTGKR